MLSSKLSSRAKYAVENDEGERPWWRHERKIGKDISGAERFRLKHAKIQISKMSRKTLRMTRVGAGRDIGEQIFRMRRAISRRAR